MTDRLLKTEELANLLGLRPQTIRAMVSKKRIPCIRIGSAVRFSEKIVNDLIAKGTTEAIR